MNARLLIVLALLGIVVLLSLSGQGPARLMVVAGHPAPTATSTSIDVLVTVTPTSTLTVTLTSTATDTPPTETAISTPIAAPRGANYLPIVLNPGGAAPTTTATAGPSPTAPPTGQIPAFSHVFIIVMENHEYSSVISNTAAPYFNSLAQQYGLATNFYAIRHPSLPNYLALTGGSTFSVTNDCTSCFINAPNLVDQLETAGKSWKAYMEGMPSPCFLGDNNKTKYVQKHNPFIYYDDIRLDPVRCNQIVPFTQFTQDLTASIVPDFAWITPDMCHDTHDCPVSTGDVWLQSIVPQILASPAWQQNGVLFITYDEGSTTMGCCTVASGGHIATVVISPLGKTAYQSAVPYHHYSLLRTIEEAWGLPLLNGANCDCSQPMADFFTLPPTGKRP